MRVRIMTAAAFTGAKVIAAILFEGTMDGEAQGSPFRFSCGRTEVSSRS
jgi:fructose-bisphosphate aldolase, class I